MSDFHEELHAPNDPEQALEAEEEPRTPPLSRLAQRYRLPIGLIVTGVMLGFLAWSILTLPEATVPGFAGIVQRFSFPLMCLLIAIVGSTWGFRLKSLWTNIAAYAAIATYVIYLVVGWIYENFIAS